MKNSIKILVSAHKPLPEVLMVGIKTLFIIDGESANLFGIIVQAGNENIKTSIKAI